MAKIALVDDHVLLRTGLSGLLQSLGHDVLFEADNGLNMQEKIAGHEQPDIILMDINMPQLDGYATALWVKENLPLVKVIALSMYDDEGAIIKMLSAGARGYILKDIHPTQLDLAIHDVLEKGFYYSDLVNGKLLHAVQTMGEKPEVPAVVLSDREKHFLSYACTELTYKEIADKMFVSPRTIDGYRDALFSKLQAKSRVGLALYAVRTGLVTVTEA